MSTRVDIGAVVALTWLVSAIGVTVVIGPYLGQRGWAWLIGHHLLCVVGCSHELWRASKRTKARELAAKQEKPAPVQRKYWWD